MALFGHLDRASLPPLTVQQTARIVPPAPRLQTYPFADLTRLREHEARLLNSYAWVDPAHQRARIPVAARDAARDRPLAGRAAMKKSAA